VPDHVLKQDAMHERMSRGLHVLLSQSWECFYPHILCSGKVRIEPYPAHGTRVCGKHHPGLRRALRIFHGPPARVKFGVLERHGDVLSGAFIAVVGLVFWAFPIL
jgi:hypothetical protein